MGLTTGTRLGRYEILSALGAGEMGDVHRALRKRGAVRPITPRDFVTVPSIALTAERLEASSTSAWRDRS